MLDLRKAPQPSLGKPPSWLKSWPAATKRWWQTWGEAAQAETFTATDWDFLLETALIHAAVWNGDLRQAPELRLRVAKFGATAEDRARLRMFATDQAATAPSNGQASDDRRSDIEQFGHLFAVADPA